MAGKLLRESRKEQIIWTKSVASLRNRDALKQELENAFDAGRIPAADVLAELFADNVEYLLRLIERAIPSQLTPLVKKLAAHGSAATARLDEKREEAAKAATVDPDAIANFAVVQWALGDYSSMRKLLAAGGDNMVRTLIIHRMPYAEPVARPVIEQLTRGEELDHSILIALWLTLGEYDQYSRTELSGQERRTVERLAGDTYQTAENGGVHSAVEWLQRRWNLKAPQVQRDLTPVSADRSWFNVPHPGRARGHTMTTFRRPAVQDELQIAGVTIAGSKRRRLEHSFAIATKEVTIAQFLVFLEEVDSPAALLEKNHAPCLETLKAQRDKQRPIYKVSWSLALKYCDWLSKSYLHHDPEKSLGENPDDVNVAEYRGIRLPQRIEWKCACQARADEEDIHGVGVAEELKRKYAWLGSESESVTTGSLKPNDWGLFDTRGNIWELCLDKKDGRPWMMGGSYQDSQLQSDVGPNRPREDSGFRIAVTVD